MKCYVILGYLIAVFVQAKRWVDIDHISGRQRVEDIINTVANVCRKRIGETEYKEIEDISHVEEPTPKQISIANKFAECIWKDLKFSDEQGVLDEENLENIIALYGNVSKEAAHTALNNCNIFHGNDYGEKARRIMRCLNHKNNHLPLR